MLHIPRPFQPAFGSSIRADRIGNPDRDHPAVLQRHEAVTQIGGGDRDVAAEPERVVLVDPGPGAVIAAFGRFAEADFVKGMKVAIKLFCLAP